MPQIKTNAETLPQRFFLEPDGDLPDCAARWILRRFDRRLRQTPPDLSRVLFLTPTRGAARLLKQALLERLEEDGRPAGVAGLELLTFEGLLDSLAEPLNPLDAETAFVLWGHVLENAAPERFPALFPNGAPARAQRPAFISQMTSLRAELAEAGHTIQSAAAALAGDPDAARWADLAELERRFLQKCRRLGRPDAATALLEAAKRLPQASYDEIVAAGFFGFSPLQRAILAGLAGGRTDAVSLLIFSDENNADLFDNWGAPLPEYAARDLKIDPRDLFVEPDPEAQALHIARLAARYGESAPRAMAVACDEKNHAGLFRRIFARVAGMPAFSPEGNPLRQTAVGARLAALAEFLKRGDVAAARAFLGDEAVQGFVARRFGLEERALRRALDAAQLEARPADLDAMLELARAAQESDAASPAPVLQWLCQSKARLLAEQGAAGLAEFLEPFWERPQEEASGEIHAPAPQDGAASSFPPQTPFRRDLFPREKTPPENDAGDDAGLPVSPEACLADDQARQLARETLCRLQAACALAENPLGADECLDYVLGALSAACARPEPDGGAVALRDWMEIFWARQPHLVLADMNEGVVPLPQKGNFFLNDQARARLGLGARQRRHARDAAMLEALYRSRKRPGRACALLAVRCSLQAEPLKPSRLLLQCAPDELPARVKRLFDDPSPAEKRAPFAPAWRLKARREVPEKRLSVTALKDYIDSPWTFYLKHLLNLRVENFSAQELDAAAFGDLFHAVWEDFALSGTADSCEPEAIARFLLGSLQSHAVRRYGENPSLYVQLQLRGAAQRLRACAQAQARWRAEGWRIYATERACPLYCEGWRLSARIDRIDYNQAQNRWCLIDYKTFDRAPENCARNRHALFDRQGHVKKWLDLQLPLYVRAAGRAFEIPAENVQAAYFLAPKNVSDCRIESWRDIGNYLESAWEKTREVLSAIERGEFAPVSGASFDDFETVFGFSQAALSRLKLVEFES